MKIILVVTLAAFWRSRNYDIGMLLFLLAIATFSGCLHGKAKPENQLVPDDFRIPEEGIAERIIFRPLRVEDAEEDYEAVMESRVRLRALFGGNWPADDFTLEQNRADLKAHQEAAEERLAFTYKIVSRQGGGILGCLYIYPSEDVDAEILFWVRDSAFDEGMQKEVLATIKQWVTQDWPFNKVSYIGDRMKEG